MRRRSRASHSSHQNMARNKLSVQRSSKRPRRNQIRKGRHDCPSRGLVCKYPLRSRRACQICDHARSNDQDRRSRRKSVKKEILICLSREKDKHNKLFSALTQAVRILYVPKERKSLTSYVLDTPDFHTTTSLLCKDRAFGEGCLTSSNIRVVEKSLSVIKKMTTNLASYCFPPPRIISGDLGMLEEYYDGRPCSVFYDSTQSSGCLLGSQRIVHLLCRTAPISAFAVTFVLRNEKNMSNKMTQCVRDAIADYNASRSVGDQRKTLVMAKERRYRGIARKENNHGQSSKGTNGSNMCFHLYLFFDESHQGDVQKTIFDQATWFGFTPDSIH